MTISAVQEALTVSRADLLVAGKRYRRGFPTSGPNTDDRFFYVGFGQYLPVFYLRGSGCKIRILRVLRQAAYGTRHCHGHASDQPLAVGG
jgi:hypothetical protein